MMRRMLYLSTPCKFGQLHCDLTTQFNWSYKPDNCSDSSDRKVRKYYLFFGNLFPLQFEAGSCCRHCPFQHSEASATSCHWALLPVKGQVLGHSMETQGDSSLILGADGPPIP